MSKTRSLICVRGIGIRVLSMPTRIVNHRATDGSRCGLLVLHRREAAQSGLDWLSCAHFRSELSILALVCVKRHDVEIMLDVNAH